MSLFRETSRLSLRQTAYWGLAAAILPVSLVMPTKNAYYQPRVRERSNNSRGRRAQRSVDVIMGLPRVSDCCVDLYPLTPHCHCDFIDLIAGGILQRINVWVL